MRVSRPALGSGVTAGTTQLAAAVMIQPTATLAVGVTAPAAQIP